MNIEAKVQQCSTPKEALLLLARELDRIESTLAKPLDPWTTPINWLSAAEVEELYPALNDNRAKIVDGEVLIDEAVSKERQVERSSFFVHARLDELLAPLDANKAREAYIAGGPRWLYYGNREAVMALPRTQREALVADILLDSPSEAEEIGRDILKFASDESQRETEQLEGLRRDYGELDAS